MKPKLDIRNIISVTVLSLIQIQSLGLSENLLIDYPVLKDFQLFILQYTKKTIKMYILAISFFTA